MNLILRVILIGILILGKLKASQDPLGQYLVPGDFYASNGRWDSAAFFYQHYLNHLSEDSTSAEIDVRQNLAEAYFFLKEKDSVKNQINQLERLFEKANDSISPIFFRYHLNKTYYFLKFNDFNTAENSIPISGKLLKHRNCKVSDSIIYYINQGIFSDDLKALEDFNLSLNIYEKHDLNDLHLKLKIFNEQGNTHLYNRRFFAAEESFKKALELRDQERDFWGFNWLETYKSLGYVCNMLGKDHQAEGYYNELKLLLNNYSVNPKEFGGLYYRLAILMRSKEDYDRAIEFYNQALPLFYDDTLTTGKINHNLGLVYKAKREFPKALNFLLNSIKLYASTNSTSKRTFALAYMNLGRLYMDNENWEQAHKYFYKSLQIYSQIKSSDQTILILPLYHQGQLYEKQAKWNTAKRIYKRALTIALNSYGKRHFQTALSYSKLAGIELLLNNHNSAKAYIGAAFDCLQKSSYTDKESNEFYNHPNEAENVYFDLCKIQAEVYKVIGKQNNDLKLLEEGLESYKIAQRWADNIRLKINSHEDKLAYLEKVNELNQYALELCFYLYSKTRSIKYIEIAFYFLEKSKANLLLEHVNEDYALKFAGIDENIIDLEKSLRIQIDNLDYEIYSITEKTQKDNLQKLRNEAFQLRQQYDSLKTYLVEQHPAYYKLKYDLKVRSIRETQQRLLKPDQAIVEYFVADDYVYIFYISPNTVVFKRVENAAGLVEQVEELRTGLFGWEKTPKSQREDSFMERHKEMYSNAAYNLYQQLLGPIAEEVALPKKMIIVPDGVLGYIPFDILLKDSIDISTPYTEYPYLIKTHQFAYCYSTTMLSEMKAIQHEKVRKEMLGIAMSFPVGYLTYDENQSRNQNEESEDLSYLRYTKPELKEIQKLVHGLSLIDSKATKEKVLKLIEQYRILHFSTHGILNDEESNLSYLALAGANRVADTGRLYVRDLYNLRLGASMVVLSACETGLGKIRKGEGIISMSRGFSYAGAKSILTTLWQVNDKSTSEIMVAFYQYLKEGKQKDEALRLAKLDYMKNVHAQSVAHPFYWAASVPIGDMSEMEFTDRSWLNYVWAIAIILIVVLGAWYWRRAFT